MKTCGSCGKEATESVLLLVGGQALIKHLCSSDLQKLLRNARAETFLSTESTSASRESPEPRHLRLVPKGPRSTDPSQR